MWPARRKWARTSWTAAPEAACWRPAFARGSHWEPATAAAPSSCPPRLVGQRPSRVAGVDGLQRLDQQHPGLVLRARAMLDAARHHVQLALFELDVAVAKLDRQAALEHEKEVIGLVVLVPDELALHLHHDHLVVVQHRHDARHPVLVESGQLVG